MSALRLLPDARVGSVLLRILRDRRAARLLAFPSDLAWGGPVKRAAAVSDAAGTVTVPAAATSVAVAAGAAAYAAGAATSLLASFSPSPSLPSCISTSSS